MVAEKFSKFKDAYNNAREHILSGNAFKHLQKIQCLINKFIHAHVHTH